MVLAGIVSSKTSQAKTGDTSVDGNHLASKWGYESMGSEMQEIANMENKYPLYSQTSSPQSSDG